MSRYPFSQCGIALALILVPILVSATDYVVTGADTVTNGSGNLNPISGAGHTLTVQSGASITTGGSNEGIHFENAPGNRILNLGRIETNGVNSDGIFSDISANSVLTNSGTITTADSFSHGMRSRFSDSTTVINNGSITVAGLSANGIYSDTSANGTLINRGTINTTGSNGNGMINASSANSLVVNSGVISTAGDAGNGLYNVGSATSTLINRGTILTQGQASQGMENNASDNSVLTNEGTISTTGSSSYGMNTTQSSGVRMTNNGLITTAGQFGFGMLGSVSDNTVFHNNGAIRLTGPRAVGMYSNFSTNSIVVNDGTIHVFGVGASGIVSNRASSVINTGVVFAGNIGESAIELSRDADRLTLGAGSRIQGLIDLGGGDDIVVLDHRGRDIAWRWTFENFKDSPPDLLSVVGAPFILEDPGDSQGVDGITVTVADLAGEANTGVVLNDLSFAIRGAVTGRIGEAVTPGDAGIVNGTIMIDQLGQPLGWTAWAKGFGGYQDRTMADLSGATRHAYGGVVVGADKVIGAHVLGAFGGFALSQLRFADGPSDDGPAREIDTNTLFGGMYGRISAGNGLFADGTLTLGYADGDPGERLRANNLVTGGIEAITGGDASGFYAASSLTLGAHVPVNISAGDTNLRLIPSLTLGQATQWRQGYSEDSSVTASQSVEDYLATVLSARLQLAAQIHRATQSGMAWSATFRAGVDASRDVSQDIDLTMGGESFSVATGDGATQLGGFVGTNLTLATSDTLALTLDGEITAKSTGGGHDSDQIGGTASVGVRMAF